MLIGKITIINRGPHGSIQEEMYEYEKALIEEFSNLYEVYKDNEVVRKWGQAKLSKNYKFSTISVINKGVITNDGLVVTIENLELKAEDTSLFVNNEEYQIEFALAVEDGENYTDLTILDIDNLNPKVYNDEESFNLSVSTTLNIPLLDEGNYILVAYIATAKEGIRVSTPISISGNITESSVDKEGLINTLSSDGEKIKLSSSKTPIINVSLTGQYIYAEIYKLPESHAYKHGLTVNSSIEYLNGNNWVAIESGSEIIKGSYRLKYLNNGAEAYVIIVIN